MNVSNLLEQASNCKTEEDAQELLSALQAAFSTSGPLSHLRMDNAEAYMEDGQPFVRFELNREISEYYITMIRPEIRSGELVVVVVTNHMKDGLGMQSRSYDVADGLDAGVLTGYSDQAIEDLAIRAKELALADHRLLIEQLGVPQQAAAEAAEKSW